jgi:hypothetical protein
MKTLLIVLVAGLGLSGCVAVPYGGGPGYAPPVVVAPAVGIGVGYSYVGRGYYGGRGRW